jgi:hypothetical protein
MHFKCPSAEIQHVDYSDSPRKPQAVNFQLIFACTVFAAASFLFGFDDKIISPVAALPDFVSAGAIIAKDDQLIRNTG